MKRLLQAIHRTNDHEREIFGSHCVGFNAHLDRWHSDLRPDQQNNNYFVPTCPLTDGDLEAARELQKKRGLDYLMIRMSSPIGQALKVKFSLEEDVIYTMALLKDTSHQWRINPKIDVRDIQTSDIGRDLLDVSHVPQQYQAQARLNMGMVLQVARRHPEYHWLCAYKEHRCWTGIRAVPWRLH